MYFIEPYFVLNFYRIEYFNWVLSIFFCVCCLDAVRCENVMDCNEAKSMSASNNQKWWQQQILRFGEMCANRCLWWFCFASPFSIRGGATPSLTSTFGNWSTDMRVTSILPISYTHRWCVISLWWFRSYAVYIVRIFFILFTMAIAHTHSYRRTHTLSWCMRLFVTQRSGKAAMLAAHEHYSTTTLWLSVVSIAWRSSYVVHPQYSTSKWISNVFFNEFASHFNFYMDEIFLLRFLYFDVLADAVQWIESQKNTKYWAKNFNKGHTQLKCSASPAKEKSTF